MPIETIQTTDSAQAAGLAIFEHETMLADAIRALISDPDIAADTLSDVKLAIMKSWHTYDPTRPFGAWASAIARNLARTTRYREYCRPQLLSDCALDWLAQTHSDIGDEAELNARCEALDICMELLPLISRQLVYSRYYENKRFGVLATQLQRSAEALRSAISRTQKVLSVCITKRLENE
jgi:RNA polymerase sigma-70 factor (ECF subfamily)